MKHDKEWALEQIKKLGYETVDKVPTGRGNDYLTTLVRIANGETFGGADFREAIHIVRLENSRREMAELDPEEIRLSKS